MALTSGCGDLYRSRLSHRTVPHPNRGQDELAPEQRVSGVGYRYFLRLIPR
jgi:hypothetical protein